MATLVTTPIKTFISGETVTPAKLNELGQSTVTLTAGTVTVADLATATIDRLLPAGAVMPFAMNSAPSGWLAANGDAVSRTTYAALFSAIGTTHGSGDGTTTFNLPDLRGIFIRGSGSQTISGRTYDKAFALKEPDDTRAHSHTYTRYAALRDGLGVAAANGWAGTATDSTGTTPTTGGTETRPANIALLYCIKH